ncbi:thyrotropin-releasing hormone-degrading ectoenzyme-like, partial [Amphibalanus amphitrite]|uniref:thyrotropin-releasing hormone-degrading ectoenzyme-like n=1 Tax=Amphibalanus amphitrite TaxID=1232801 RepID=UPI001C8FD646
MVPADEAVLRRRVRAPQAMTSREELAMDPHSVTFTKNSGVFVTRRCGLLLLLLFAGALLITGLLVRHFHGTSCQQDGASAGDSAAAGAGPTLPTKPRDVRLPRHLAPEGYKIRLLPFIEEGNFTFNGEVTATLRADAPGKNVTLHVNEMIVLNDSVTVKDATTGKMVGMAGYKYDTDREFFIILLERSVEVGHKYEVYVKYIGSLTDKLAGFYRSSYKTPEGEKRWIAVTQFQPTDARKAFPCLDEPALKATFQITLGRRKTMTSISNMPIKMTEPHKEMAGYEWDIYEKSVPMSTYLVAFAVTDFAVRESDPGLSNTLFR